MYLLFFLSYNGKIDLLFHKKGCILNMSLLFFARWAAKGWNFCNTKSYDCTTARWKQSRCPRLYWLLRRYEVLSSKTFTVKVLLTSSEAKLLLVCSRQCSACAGPVHLHSTNSIDIVHATLFILCNSRRGGLSKAELLQVAFFPTQFPSLGFFFSKNGGNWKYNF